MQNAKIGRNQPCPCGSGKKYKACCVNSSNLPPVMGVDELLKRAWQAVAHKDAAATQYWFKQVLAINPKQVQALAGLGQVLCWQMQRREGLAYLQQAAQLLGTDAQAQRDIRFIMQLAEQLHYWGDLATALSLSEQAVNLAPNDMVALNNHALYLTRVNRYQQALPYAIKVCALRADDPACNNLLAIIEAKLDQPQAAKQRLQRVISANQNPTQTARAWQELVAVLDKLGEFEQAFAACLQAKAHYQQLPVFKQYNPEHIFECLQRNQQGFDSALLQRFLPAQLVDNQPLPVFLMGFLRSGTTLTEQVLAAHPAVLTSDENDLIHGLSQQLQKLTGCGNDFAAGLRQLDRAGIKQLRAHYWQAVAQEYGPTALQQCFINKVALNSIDIGLISCVFPEAKIIFALRDPRDVCLSCFQQAFAPSNVTVNLLTWSGVAKQYAAVMRLWLSLKGQILPQFLELRYEDTVTDFENSFRQVFELLELPYHDEIQHFHQQAEQRYIATPSFSDVSQPLYQRSLARWQHYQPQIAAILAELDPFIKAFGYQN